jgi:GTPase Era involved in 16S rRNA processing
MDQNDQFSKIENSLSLLNSLEVLKNNQNLLLKFNLINNKAKDKELQLVVLGQFKRGKTTLINALIGSNLLPTSAIPLTSVVTILKYGDKPKAYVNFLDGNKKEINISELEEYIAEEKNPKNKKKVDRVIIEYPSLYLKDGVQIIDTPGVGSVYEHNTDIAYKFVPQADAGIFVVTADPPISASELSFLTSIKDYLSKILFVQNKIDQVGVDEHKQSLVFTKRVIEANVKVKNLTFYPLSSKLALDGKVNKDNNKLQESHFLGFEKALTYFLKKEKSQVLVKSISSKLLYLINEINLIIQLEKKAVQIPFAILKEKIGSFEKELINIRQQKEDADFILQGQMEKLVKETLIEDIEILKEKEAPILLKDLEIFYKNNLKLNGKDLANKFNLFLEQSIKQIFRVWRKAEETKLQQSLQSILDRFSKETNSSIQKVVDLSANLFDLHKEKFEAGTELAKEQEFRFSYDEFKVDIEIFTPVVSRLPKFLSHGLLYKNAQERAEEELDQHCGRVRYDFHQRIIKSINDYRNILDEALEETINEINTAMKNGLKQKEKGKEEEKSSLIKIQKQEEILTTAKEMIIK